MICTSLPPAALAASVLHALRELNPKQPAAEFRPIRTIVDRADSPRRFFMLLVAAFAGLGLLLAALGIYGVISYSVTRKTQEIGVRMALGASAGRVRRDVILNTLRLAVAGLVMGTIASLVSARLIASLLRHRAQSSQSLLQNIVADVRQFSPHEQHDDITLIIAKSALSPV